jgi:hypothetical protein
MFSHPCISMIFRLQLATFAIVALCRASFSPALAADADFHYLAADPSLRAGMQNVNVVMGQADYVGKVLELDQSWESPYKLIYTGSVVIDPTTGQWRLYYEMMKTATESQRCVAMAVSDDGLHWTKPALDITGTKYTTDHRNNFIKLPQTWMCGPNVFIDPNAPAGQQYRMTAAVNETTFYALTSADGLNFTTAGTIFTKHGGPSVLDALNTAFWDPKTQDYIAYMRVWFSKSGDIPLRRGVFSRRSGSWSGDWTADTEDVIDPKDIDNYGTATGRPDVYCPNIVAYHGQYVGLPAMFFHPNGTDGAIYPTFTYSRDGENWHFDDVTHPIIDLAAHGQNASNFGMAYPATSLIERDGQLWIYYSYFAEQHNKPRSSGTIYLAKLRADGFVGIESAAGAVGKWTTSAITLSDEPGSLLVNAVVGGSLKIEVLDPTTLAPLPGYAASDCLAIAAGDYLGAEGKWNGIGNLNALAGRTVALRFIMDDATIYSFRFDALPEPPSFMLGGIALFAVASFVLYRQLAMRSGQHRRQGMVITNE